MTGMHQAQIPMGRDAQSFLLPKLNLVAHRFPTIPDRLFWRRLLVFVEQKYRRQLTAVCLRAWGGRVQFGPFAGLQLEETCSWGDGDILSKLIGTYEAELHGIIARTCHSTYSTIVNIGCAEGFYAVGFARALPNARVIAFDRNSRAREICVRTAKLNGVSQRVHVMRRCTAPRLRKALENAEPTFLLVDCEGAEEELLSPRDIPALAQTDMLIECHEFVRPNVVNVLRERFKDTHCIDQLHEDARSLDQFALLGQLSSLDRAVITCEHRPNRMTWLYCCANASTSHTRS